MRTKYLQPHKIQFRLLTTFIFLQILAALSTEGMMDVHSACGAQYT